MKSKIYFLIITIVFTSMVVFGVGSAEAKYKIVVCVTFPKTHFFGMTADKFAEVVHKYYKGDVGI